MGPNTRLIMEEAQQRGINVSILADDHSIIELEHNGEIALFRGSLIEKTSGTFVIIASHKDASYKVLKHYGFNTPETIAVKSEDDAVEKARRMGYPVVIKPSSDHQGIGVTAHITSDQELRAAFQYAQKNKTRSKKILLQKHISGRDYRVLVIDYKVFAVAERVPAHVTGDGISTIEKLVAQKNKARKDLKDIPLDESAVETLKKQSFTIDSVPEKGSTVYLKSIANIATGGEVIECTDAMPDENRELFESVAKALHGNVVGIDVICEDITQPVNNQYTIIELNQNPDFYPFLSPTKGKPRNAAPEILRLVFPNI